MNVASFVVQKALCETLLLLEDQCGARGVDTVTILLPFICVRSMRDPIVSCLRQSISIACKPVPAVMDSSIWPSSSSAAPPSPSSSTSATATTIQTPQLAASRSRKRRLHFEDEQGSTSADGKTIQRAHRQMKATDGDHSAAAAEGQAFLGLRTVLSGTSEPRPLELLLRTAEMLRFTHPATTSSAPSSSSSPVLSVHALHSLDVIVRACLPFGRLRRLLPKIEECMETLLSAFVVHKVSSHVLPFPIYTRILTTRIGTGTAGY